MEGQGLRPAQAKVGKTLSTPIDEHGGMCLSSQATQEAEIRRSWFQASLCKKFTRPFSTAKSYRWLHTPVIQTTVGSINRRISSGWLWKRVRLCLKNNQRKRG
jgi:hypothetical protein